MVNDEFSPYELSAVDLQYPDTRPFVAPYWIENDLSQGGNVSYGVFTGVSAPLVEVSNFISQSEGVQFSGTWMLVAHWIMVPFFGSIYEDEITVSVFVTESSRHINKMDCIAKCSATYTWDMVYTHWG